MNQGRTGFLVSHNNFNRCVERCHGNKSIRRFTCWNQFLVMAVVATVPVGSVPFDVAVNPAGTRVYVTNRNSDTVSVIDTATNTVVATVTVGLAPAHVTVNTAGTRVYVSNVGGSVSVIDTAINTVVATISGFSSPQGVAVR